MTMNVEKVCEQVTEFVTYVEGFYVMCLMQSILQVLHLL